MVAMVAGYAHAEGFANGFSACADWPESRYRLKQQQTRTRTYTCTGTPVPTHTHTHMHIHAHVCTLAATHRQRHTHAEGVDTQGAVSSQWHQRIRIRIRSRRCAASNPGLSPWYTTLSSLPQQFSATEQPSAWSARVRARAEQTNRGTQKRGTHVGAGACTSRADEPSDAEEGDH